MATTQITINSITIDTNQPGKVTLTYSNGNGDVEELSAGTINYTFGPDIAPYWNFVGISPTGKNSSDITSSVSNRTLTLNDAYTVVPESFDFLIVLTDGRNNYSSQDPEIRNKAPA